MLLKEALPASKTYFGQAWALHTLYVTFDTIESAHNSAFSYEINSSNAPERKKGHLKVEVEKMGEDAIEKIASEDLPQAV